MSDRPRGDSREDGPSPGGGGGERGGGLMRFDDRGSRMLEQALRRSAEEAKQREAEREKRNQEAQGWEQKLRVRL